MQRVNNDYSRDVTACYSPPLSKEHLVGRMAPILLGRDFTTGALQRAVHIFRRPLLSEAHRVRRPVSHSNTVNGIFLVFGELIGIFPCSVFVLVSSVGGGDADSLCRPPSDLFFSFPTSAPPFPFSLLLERGRRGYGLGFTKLCFISRK